ncbi:ADP-ribosylglycohydrolase family protein [Candidatus Woesearchaeota archaeon]|nr:ADP-ribosylglycohydrolase family protein [Candidatus Woesearchaeota archaeon]
MATLEERYQATLVGAALGDALGMPVERMTQAQIQKYVGRITTLLSPVIITDDAGQPLKQDEFGELNKYPSQGLERGEYSDDTILAIALAESLLKTGYDFPSIVQNQLAVYLSKRLPLGEIGGGFGKSTRNTFENLIAEVPPTNSGMPGPGNAPTTKMITLGLYMHPLDCPEQGALYAKEIARITHTDPRSIASGIVQSHAIYRLLEGIDREDFLAYLPSLCDRYERPLGQPKIVPEKGMLTDYLRWIHHHRDATPDAAHAFLHSGSEVFESYSFALFMFQKYWDDPVVGLFETVNYGGDCDSTGAMYGALAGAKHGMIFPSDLTQEIKGVEYLCTLGTQFWRLRS